MYAHVCVPTLVNVRWFEGKTEQKDGSARHAHHTAVAAKKKKTESSLFSEMSIVVDGLQDAPSNWAVA